jgi:hypothetical protein
VVWHPHDVRIGDQQLKSIVEQENRKFKETAALKKKMQKCVKSQLEGKTVAQLCVITDALSFSFNTHSLVFPPFSDLTAGASFVEGVFVPLANWCCCLRTSWVAAVASRAGATNQAIWSDSQFVGCNGTFGDNLDMTNHDAAVDVKKMWLSWQKDWIQFGLTTPRPFCLLMTQAPRHDVLVCQCAAQRLHVPSPLCCEGQKTRIRHGRRWNRFVISSEIKIVVIEKARTSSPLFQKVRPWDLV